MKIIMIISTPFPPEEGIGYHVLNVSRELVKRGHEITILTRGALGTEHSIYDGIEVIRVPFVPAYPIHVWIHKLFLGRRIREMQGIYDFIHAHTPMVPAVSSNLPMLCTIHTSIIEDARHIKVVDAKSLAIKGFSSTIGYHLVQELMTRSEVVTAVSESVARELREYYGVSECVIVRNGADATRFRPSSRTTGERSILYVGRLTYRKGLDDLIHLAAAICEKHDVNLHIVGKGDLENRLRRMTRELNLERRVTFFGHVSRERLVELYQNAALFISPSHYESGPLTLLEAMACGIPVVATRTGIAPEVVEDGRNGLLVPPNSLRDLIQAASRILGDEDFGRKMGINARHTIEHGWTWELIVDSLESCYLSRL